jgi:hypothetical protein
MYKWKCTFLGSQNVYNRERTWIQMRLIFVILYIYIYIYIYPQNAHFHLMYLIHSFNHLVVCLTTGPKPLPKRAIHIVRSRASSFKWEYPLLSLRSFNSFLRLLPCLPVTSIPPPLRFSSIIRCIRQFLHKMCSIQFAFRLRISCRTFLSSLTLSNTSSYNIPYNNKSHIIINCAWKENSKYVTKYYSSRFVSSRVVSCVEQGMFFLSCYRTSVQDTFYTHIVWPLHCGPG